MAAAIRYIWGPYRSILEDRKTEKNPAVYDVRWYFHGVRSDGCIASWILTFDVSARRWQAHGMGNGKSPEPDRMNAMLPMNIADMPVLTGRVVDLLRARLGAEEIARVTRLTIAAAR